MQGATLRKSQRRSLELEAFERAVARRARPADMACSAALAQKENGPRVKKAVSNCVGTEDPTRLQAPGRKLQPQRHSGRTA
jgi:hypothetical protein